MSLKYALVGFLNLAPMTGYEIKKNLDRSTSHFWSAGLNQIYPTLGGLEAEGWITSMIEPQDGRPDRKVYRLTATGRHELLDWLAEPPEALARSRNAGLLKLFFAGYLEKDQVLRQLHAQLELHRRQLAGYEVTRGIIREKAGQASLERPAVFWELVRELGEEHERTWVSWLEKAIHTVEGMEDEREGES
jgi:PadR family transcriptional regulator AphA